jgi:pimeloyl-ACP methyl ester carboxylesterase
VPAASEHTATIGEQLVLWRSADGPDGSAQAPALYLHGVPTSSEDWTAFLARTGGLAPDLPGFGRSGKRGDGDYTMAGYDAFVEAFLGHLGVERVRLVVHDWGAAGLLWAQRFPERVERLVVVNAVPLVAGYRWHRVARAWRTPGLGELVMGATTRWSLRRALPPALRDAAWRHFDPGTQRAILRLYRTSGEDALAAAGARLGAIACPALVVWGDRDPYIPPRFADAYAAVLGDARAVHLADAGHWPWTDRPDVVDRVAAFLAGEPPPAAER